MSDVEEVLSEYLAHEKGSEMEPKEDFPEVSQAMLEAGLQHLYAYHPDRGVGDEETVTRIFQSMYRLLASGRTLGAQ